MTATRSARERKAAREAGSLGTVRIDLDADRQFVYKIACASCVVRDGRTWTTYRPGEDNGYLAAMDRWTFHLTEKHPGEEVPCLTYLAEAQQRLQERRDARRG